MRKPFSGDYRVSQKFGENPQYYKQFGFAGHEGVDFAAPNGTPILSVASGVVVRRNDVKNGAYGIYVVVWHEELSLATWYCHLQEVKVKIGEKVSEGQTIALSGNTGNTTGPHLHLNLCRTNSKGYRINKDNGYKGFIDPLPFLEKEGSMDPEIIKRADAFVAVATKLGKAVDKDIILSDLDRLISLEDKLVERDKALQQKEKEHDDLVLRFETLQTNFNSLEKEYHGMKSSFTDQLEEMRKIKDDLEKYKDIKPIDDYTATQLIRRALGKIFNL